MGARLQCSALYSRLPPRSRAAVCSPAWVAQQQRVSAPVMMAKKVTKIIKLAIDAGSANPAPPIGPALGSAGVNIMMFCKEYNARTSDKKGQVIPVEISVFEDRSFTFILKTPPAAELLKAAAKVKKGTGTPAIRSKSGDLKYETVATIDMAQVEEIAKVKLPDLNTNKIASAMNTVIGTAKNMGSTRRAPPRARRTPHRAARRCVYFFAQPTDARASASASHCAAVKVVTADGVQVSPIDERA